MPPIYAKQIMLTSQGTFENLGPTSARKFLRGFPQNVGWKVPRTLLLTLGAFFFNKC